MLHDAVALIMVELKDPGAVYYRSIATLLSHGAGCTLTQPQDGWLAVIRMLNCPAPQNQHLDFS